MQIHHTFHAVNFGQVSYKFLVPKEDMQRQHKTNLFTGADLWGGGGLGGSLPPWRKLSARLGEQEWLNRAL